MDEVEVCIVELEPMRVAFIRVINSTPERDAWEKMRAWAEPKGLLNDIKKHPVFGFNNPSPSPDSKEYGYEFWIKISPDIQAEAEIQVKDFPGGRYAVTTCKQLANIAETWMKLFDWVKSSRYKWRRTHELEKPHDPRAAEESMVLDLYLPIES